MSSIVCLKNCYFTDNCNNLCYNLLQHENAVVATQRAKQGVTQLFGGISKALSVEAEDLKKPGQKQNPHSKHIFDRAQVVLAIYM